MSEQADMNGEKGAVARDRLFLLPRWGWGMLLFAWALFITWQFLGKPLPTGPDSRMRQGEYFLRVIGQLVTGSGWNWYVGWELVVDIAIGAAGLCLMTLVGWLLTMCFRVYMPFTARLALAYAMGVGAVGIGATLLGFVGQIKTLPAWGMVIGLGAAFYIVSRHLRLRREKDLEEGATPIEGRSRRRCEEVEASMWEQRGVLPVWKMTDRCLVGALLVLFSVLTLLTFYHGVLFPETYWDSLILYLGHARAIFEEGGFPRKVVLQVGVGLGANYPHLFELTGATIATWAHRWSPVYLQIASPLAGLATLVLVYHAVLRQTRSNLAALTVIVLLRSLPHLIEYHIFASNYSYVTLYSAAFFYCALRYLDDGLPGYFILASLAAAFGVHINYLMGTLWLAWVVLVFVGHFRPLNLRRNPDGEYVALSDEAMETDTGEYPTPEAAMVKDRPGLGTLLSSKWFWTMAVCTIGIGAIWYVRNWIVTGNPVYAFFPEIFTRTKHFNPEVLESANKEWQAHGAGIGIMGESVIQRIHGSWSFFVSDSAGTNVAWRWAPSMVGLAFPGLLIWLWRIIVSALRGKAGPLERLGIVAIVFAAILFGYHYLIGPFYLYHLLGVIGVAGLFMGAALERVPASLKRPFALWAILCAIIPGLTFGLMGAKVKSGPYGPLTALRNPGAPPEVFNFWKFGPSSRLWEVVNEKAEGTALLTHENRHLLFDPSIQLVHMDDWEVQQLWGEPELERLHGLWKLGVRYYLEAPFEFDHAINARLGHRQWVESGLLWPVSSARDDTGRPHVLYRFLWPTGPEPTEEDWQALLSGEREPVKPEAWPLGAY